MRSQQQQWAWDTEGGVMTLVILVVEAVVVVVAASAHVELPESRE